MMFMLTRLEEEAVLYIEKSLFMIGKVTQRAK